MYFRYSPPLLMLLLSSSSSSSLESSSSSSSLESSSSSSSLSFIIFILSSTIGEISQTGPALVFTDMPGFGFAYMTQEDLLRTQEITKSYLTKRGNNLKRVLLLLDARHGLKIGDEKFFRELFATTISSLNGERKEVNSLKRKTLQIFFIFCNYVI